MTKRRVLILAVWFLTLAIGFGLGTAVGQQKPPTDNKGVDAKVVSTVDLAPDIPGLQLRLRTISIEPGGHAGIHSHKDRPAFAYILEGTLTEFREGGYMKEYGPGGVITESRDVTHWAENKGSAKVVLVGVDIVKP
jgi:quercetin dioxygenase-like cupin family protein